MAIGDPDFVQCIIFLHFFQSLLERNKNLYKKTEALETYVNEVEERV